MKKIEFGNNKLLLNKTTIANLNQEDGSNLAAVGFLSLWNCKPKPGTAIGPTCVTAGISCGCPTKSQKSICVAACHTDVKCI